MPITLAEGEQRELNFQLTPIPPEPATLFGHITDIETGDPILGARVSLLQGEIEIYYQTSDVNGYYEITNIVPGSYDGLITASGYIDQTF